MKTTKKYLSLVCCAICAIATCLALVACGGGKAAKGAKMVGYWELVSGKADGTELTEDDIQMMNDWGMKVVLYLGEDGKATLDLFGEVQDSTWDIEKCTLGYDGETGTLELADDKLTFAAEETSLVFKKGDDSLADQIKTDRESEKITDMGDPDDGDDGTTSSAEAATVPIDPPVTIADDEIVTVVATDRAADEWGQVGIMLTITNNSDRKIGMSIPNDSCAVNGVMNDNWFYTAVLPGTSATKLCAFEGIDSIDELVNIQCQLDVYDDETYEDIASYPINIQ